MSPILLPGKMIDKNRIISLVEHGIQGTGIFLVEVKVKPGNSIRVHVDRPDGISIEQCAEISRYLNQHLDRDEDDYSLEVSSPGVGVPFKVKQQYEKNRGHVIEVVLPDGTKTEGMLESVTDDGFTVKGSKGEITLSFDEIKSARETIKFS
jgi:ribosome maturation factor RimP